MAETSVAFAINLPNELRAEVENLARQYDQSPAQFARDAVAAYVTDKKAYLSAIDEALEEAEDGEFISSEAAERWMLSWGTDKELPMPTPDISIEK